MKKFFGRESYLDKLSVLWRKSTSSFVVVVGRRRIGKSTRVEEFAARAKCDFIELVGLAPDEQMDNQKQIDNFCERLAKRTGTPRQKADCWARAFDALDDALKGRGRTIVFLDEISWMGKYDSSFAALLKTAWDTQFSKHDRLIFIVAGSVSAWINQNIQKSKGFVGRLSLDFTLPELPPDQCLGFWGRKADRTSTGDILDMLAVTGGVPKYLDEIDPSHSPDENIRRLCYDPDGYLFKDFDRIFDDVFGGSVQAKKRILSLLAEKPASVSELAAEFGSDPNGHLSENLSELEEAGFIAGSKGTNPITGKRIREVRYRLRDNYTRFYLRYILPKKETIANGFYQYVPLDRLPGWDAIMGLQFENLVVNNYGMLIPYLHLKNVLLTSAAPYRKMSVPSLRQKGCQIDLLIQSRRTVYIVEVKRMAEIGRGIIEEVDAKVRCLKTRPNVSIRTALVYDGHLAPIVEADGYFDAIVPFHALLGLGSRDQS